MIEAGGHQSFHVSVAFGVLGRHVLLLMLAASSIHTNARVSELDGDPLQRTRRLRFN